ncbi:gamma carbonic anhydrase family protein [Humidisolicoccus flavus]|uniref:gamma carbonic anhydrase family protein n=1 Tax=Humidisolicoccus flavus TaxID=3111414 RepID=UPI003250DA8D
MTIHERATVVSLPDRTLDVADEALVLPGAFLAGEVSLAAHVSIWPGASLRAEHAGIAIGEGSNIQDSVSCHVDAGFPLTLGRGVSVGHNAVIHGCTIDDDVLIGMSATVMNGARIGAGSIIAAGALVTEGVEIPPRSLVAGVPGKVRREVTDEEFAGIRQNAATYTERLAIYVDAFASQHAHENAAQSN